MAGYGGTAADKIAVAAASVPADLKNKWRLAFNEFDQMNNGVITAEELEAVMREHLKMHPAPGEVQAMIAAVDHDMDNAVSYEEFELMMVAAGRGNHGGKLGFAHVVDRFIRMSDIATLITTEAAAFVEQFCAQHREKFTDLVTLDQASIDANPSYMDTYKLFTEEAELMMQNVLMLWGTASMNTFDDDFLEVVSQHGIADSFLQYTDYGKFMAKMYEVVQNPGSYDGPVDGAIPRPETPAHASTTKRLSQLDKQLQMLDYQRNQVLAERRRLVGCEVQPITTTALKRELEKRQWLDDVGND